jgi:hypothetical protein
VLAVVGTRSTTTGGAFAQVAFGIAVVGWMTVTSVLMIRDRDDEGPPSRS